MFLSIALAVTGTSVLAQEADPYRGFKLPPVDVQSEFPHMHKYVAVLGSKMAYIDEGNGDPIVFCTVRAVSRPARLR